MHRLALAKHLFLGKADLSDEVRLGLADALLAWASCLTGDHDTPRVAVLWRRRLVRLQRHDPRLFPILLRLVEPMPDSPRHFAGVAACLWTSLPDLVPPSAWSDVPPLDPATPADQAFSDQAPQSGRAKRIGAASPRPHPRQVTLRIILWAEEFAAAWAREHCPTVLPFVRAACIVSALAGGILPDPLPDGAGSFTKPPQRGRSPRTAAPNRRPAFSWPAYLERWKSDEPSRAALEAAAIGWEIAAKLWELAPGVAVAGRRTSRRSRKSDQLETVGIAALLGSTPASAAADRVRVASAEWVEALRSATQHPVRQAFVRAERLYRRLTRRIPNASAMTARAAYAAIRLYALESNFAATLERAKLDAMAEFAAGAGHEINNPLAIISGHAQVLLRRTRDPEERRILAAITAQVRRAHEMIADARLFARPPQPSLSRINLCTVAAQVEPSLRDLADRYGTTVDWRLPTEPVEVHADPVQVATALTALVKNAVESAAEGGRVVVTLHAREEEAAFEVRDNGPGISPEQRRHIFDPYYSARQAGRGLGLGLSKAWRIAQMHGGAIDVDSRPGQDTVFTLRLPRRPESRDQG
ncbi:sensor histidine kinase [Thermopirellula anaerolimosa]